jgi:hypothetical protein
MSLKTKRRKKAKKSQVVLAKLQPKHVLALGEIAKSEPLVIAAIPKSHWDKFVDWLKGE